MSGVLPATFLEVVLFEIFKLETVHLSIELCQYGNLDSSESVTNSVLLDGVI
jgi:hypothetical protein